MTDYIEAIMEMDQFMKRLKYALLNKQYDEARLAAARLRHTASKLDEQIVKQFPETVA